jgi:uncharacterized protein YmfQ (DUF2313 family)
MLEKLIGPIMGATGKLIAEVVGMVAAGRTDAARAKVSRFVSATNAQLDGVSQEANDILDDRFPDTTPPSSGG